jgi:hypothetical protein
MFKEVSEVRATYIKRAIALTLEVVNTSETSNSVYQTKRRSIPEDSKLF